MRKFTLKFKVRSYECDSYGHVNNAVYLHYLECARMSALEENGLTLNIMKQKGYFVVVRRIEIDYKHPLFMNDMVIIKTFISEWRNTSGTFTQQIFNADHKRLVAEAKVTWVFTNLTGKPIPIPEEIQLAFKLNK